MTDIPEVPKPITTGADGTQSPAKSDIAVIPVSPLAELPLARELEGLVAKGSKALGGDVASAFVMGATRQLAHDLTETKDELKATREHLERSQDNLFQCRERKAVLEERLRSERDSRQLRNLCIAIGTALIGYAINLYTGNSFKESVVVGVFGALLLVLGWVSVSRSEK